MARKRNKPIPMRPSRAQGMFFARFEELYFNAEGHTLDTIPLGEPPTEEKKKPEGWKPGVPRRTYGDWRNQTSSPTIRDLEKLCALTGERQTLVVDPSLRQNQGDDDMGWYDEALEYVGEMANMGELARGKVLAKMEQAIRDVRAQEGARNPLEPGEALGSRHARRK